MLLKLLLIISFFTFSINPNIAFSELVGFTKVEASGTYAPPPPFPDDEDEEDEDEE